jgi:Ca2+-binding EF-hand superfamily protein
VPSPSVSYRPTSVDFLDCGRPRRNQEGRRRFVRQTLDTDKDGTLSFKELHGRLSRKEFTAADTDKDQSLTKEEYLAVVELRFKAADRDHDGTMR